MVDDLRDDRTGENRGWQRRDVGNGTQGTAWVRGLVRGMGVDRLCRADKKNEKHAQQYEQNPGSLGFVIAAWKKTLHSVVGRAAKEKLSASCGTCETENSLFVRC